MTADKSKNLKRGAALILLGILVAFTVFYALIMPVSTMTGSAPEHRHTDECYEMRGENGESVLVCTEKSADTVYLHGDVQPEDSDYSEEAVHAGSFELVMDGYPKLLAASENALVLKDENITHVSVSYKVGNKWVTVTDENNHDLPADASYKFTLDYVGIDIQALIEADMQLIYGPFPQWFLPNKMGTIVDEDEVAAMFTVNEDGMIVIQFEENWIKRQEEEGKHVIAGDFTVSGEIDWDKIQPGENGNTKVPGTDTMLDFEDELASKYGNILIDKSVPELVKAENGKYYLKYSLTVTSMEETAAIPEVRVKDSFAGAGYVKGYAGVSDTPSELPDRENGIDPWEKSEIDGVAQEGLAPGRIVSKDGGMEWTIAELQPGEQRTLTYYAELEDSYVSSTSWEGIRNDAEVFSKDYSKGTDSSNFVPSARATLVKELSEDNIDPATGKGELTYTMTITAYDSNSFSMKDLSVRDFFPEKLRGFIYGDDDEITVIADDGDGHAREYKASYKDASFELSLEGMELAPGQSITLTYTVKVEKIFAADNGSIDLTNTAYLSNGGKTIDTSSVTKTLQQSSWMRKIAGDAVRKSFTVKMGKDDRVYGYDCKQVDNPGSFTVEKGSIGYNVIVNEDGKWDLSSAIMKDKFGNDYLKYTGYVRVQAFRREPSEKPPTDAELLLELEDSEPVETVWLYVNEKGEFSFKPGDLGFDKDKYTFLLTYYAEPNGMEGIGKVNVGNSFSIWGSVGTGNGSGGYIEIPALEINVNSVVQGGLKYEAEKQSWYYEPYPVYQKPEKGEYKDSEFKNDYENGAIYWIIRLEGEIPEGHGSGPNCGRSNTMTGFYLRDDPDGSSRFKRDSVMGVFIASRQLDITDYGSYEEFLESAPWQDKLSGSAHNDKWFKDTPVDKVEYEWYAENTYIEGIAFPDGCKLRGDQAIYIVIRTSPTNSLPLDYYAADNPTMNSNMRYKSYMNTLSVASGGSQPEEVGAAEYLYENASELFKEAKYAYIYNKDAEPGKEWKAYINGEWQDCYNKSGDNNRPGAWKNELKETITESGTYAEWLMNVNWNGDMEGEAFVSDFLPEGVEPVYIGVLWRGRNASSAGTKCEIIPELEGSAAWTKIVQQTDQGTAISYYNPATREIRWRIVDLAKGSTVIDGKKTPSYNTNQINLQIICKITDEDIMFSRMDSTLDNLAVCDHRKSVASVGINKEGSMDKELKTAADNNPQMFEINVNRAGEMLRGGEELPPLIDELGEDIQLIQSTLEITYADGTPVEGASGAVREKDGRETLIISGLPDGRHIIISYQTRFRSGKNPGDKVIVTNNAYWNGYRPYEDDPQVNEEGSYQLSGNVSAFIHPSVEITKVDSEQSDIKLRGAKFAMYAVGDNSVLDPEPVRSGVTDESGRLVFEYREEGSPDLEFNKVYCIKETSPPSGYKLNKEESERYFVVVNQPNAIDHDNFTINGISYRDVWDKLDIWSATPTYEYTVTNEKQKIYVEKVFENEEGEAKAAPASGKFRFGLYDTDNITEKTIPLEILTIEYTENGGVKYYLDDVEIDISPETLPYFTRNDPSGVYYVLELSDNGTPMTGNGIYNVGGGSYRVSYEVNGELTNRVMFGKNTVVVTNREKMFILPETGGKGRGRYCLAGLILVTLALAELFRRRIADGKA